MMNLPCTTHTALGSPADSAGRLTPGPFAAGAPRSSIASSKSSAENGDPAAAETLFAQLYGELHRLARRELGRRGGRASLGATTLLHEAYLDISGRDGMVFPDPA